MGECPGGRVSVMLSVEEGIVSPTRFTCGAAVLRPLHVCGSQAACRISGMLVLALCDSGAISGVFLFLSCISLFTPQPRNLPPRHGGMFTSVMLPLPLGWDHVRVPKRFGLERRSVCGMVERKVL